MTPIEQAAVRNLLGFGWITLFRRKGFDGEPVTYEPVEPDQIEEVLSSPHSWYPEYAGESIEFGATEGGVSACRSGAARWDVGQYPWESTSLMK